MEAKSSIHISAGQTGYLAHNDRSRPTVNSIFDDEENEVSNTKEQAFALYREELQLRAGAYYMRTEQKLQKTTKTHLTAIVNLNGHHDMKDLRKIADHLEETFGTKVFQIAIHRDEGHINADGVAQKNYHAHIEMMGLDEEGRSVRKKLTRSALISLQTDVADLLGMQRGVNYTQERRKRPKRLGTYEFKAQMAREEPLKATLKDLKEEIGMYRQALRNAKAERADYAALEKNSEILKKRIKEEGLTVAELRQQLADLQAQNEQLAEEKEELFADAYQIDHEGEPEFSYKDIASDLWRELQQIKELFTLSHRDNLIRSDMTINDYIDYLIEEYQEKEPTQTISPNSLTR